MGNLDSTVDVSIISMLAISNPEFIPTLMQLARTFQDEEFLTGLKSASTEDEVLGLYKRIVPDVVEKEK